MSICFSLFFECFFCYFVILSSDCRKRRVFKLCLKGIVKKRFKRISLPQMIRHTPKAKEAILGRFRGVLEGVCIW